jgi:hypothetical protein
VRRKNVPGEADSLRTTGQRVGAWWASLIAGQVEQSHPIHGSKISAKVEGDTLVVRGKLPSEDDLAELRAELEHIAGHGVAHVRIEVTVDQAGTQQRGLLRQTLIGVFETAELAGFAAGYLEGHAQVPREAMLLVEADSDDAPKDRAALDDLGPPFTDQARALLDNGRSLLIVSVDEVDAFRVRELLDEETRSLETLVLPPQTASSQRSALNEDAAPADNPAAKRAQQQALREESRTHAD